MKNLLHPVTICFLAAAILMASLIGLSTNVAHAASLNTTSTAGRVRVPSQQIISSSERPVTLSYSTASRSCLGGYVTYDFFGDQIAYLNSCLANFVAATLSVGGFFAPPVSWAILAYAIPIGAENQICNNGVFIVTSGTAIPTGTIWPNC